MPKLQQLDVQLDHPQAVFFAGQTVSGRLNIVLSEPIKLRAIRLELRGKAFVRWTTTSHHNDGEKSYTRTHVHTTSENYINNDLLLWQQNVGDAGNMFPAGASSLMFQFQIPTNCPTSFEGAWGNIRYFIKGVLDRPWKFNHTCKQMVTVIGIVDLNAIPLAAEPTHAEGAKELGMLFWKSGKISADIRLDRFGYVPGDIILIDADINNGSKKAIQIRAKLVQKTIFKVGFRQKLSEQKVAELAQTDKVEPGQTITWKQQPLQIPSVPPVLNNCSIIEVSYILDFELDPDGMHTDLNVKLPILIGTIPIRQATLVGGTYPQQGATAPSVEFMQPPTYPNEPPPSYAECVSGKINARDEDDNKYTRGQLEYAPLYPIYETKYT